MCDICGKLDFTGSPVDEDILRRMTDLLSHRRRGDSGVYLRRIRWCELWYRSPEATGNALIVAFQNEKA